MKGMSQMKKKENNIKKENKKLDKTAIFTKIMAGCLVAFTIVGTCYTFIYLVVNG